MAAVIRKMQPEERAEVASFPRLTEAGGETRKVALVALVESRVAGCAEMAPTFFQREFVSLLIIRPEYRRRGLGIALMKALESKCRTEELFTSTNVSNRAMQELLHKLGYRQCGSIDGLDEGDPELIFMKRLQRTG